MIIEFLINIFLGLIGFILSLFSLPGMPAPVLGALDSAIPFMTLPVSILRTYAGDAFFAGLMNLVLLLFAFSILWRPAMWLYNKIRGSGN